MDPEDIHSLCRLCGIFSENMIDVLMNGPSKNEDNILEIIHNCLPVQVYRAKNGLIGVSK